MHYRILLAFIIKFLLCSGSTICASIVFSNMIKALRKKEHSMKKWVIGIVGMSAFNYLYTIFSQALAG